MPTEKAHGIQIMKMCEAFTSADHKIELIVPFRFNHLKKDSFKYYGVRRNFKIKKIPALDLINVLKIRICQQIFFLLHYLSFSLTALIYTSFRKADVIYSRDELPLYFLSFFKNSLFWETHIFKKNFVVQRLLRKCQGLVVITEKLKELYISNSADSEKIIVAPDGVDLQKFDIEENHEECRCRLNLPLDKKLIVYTGHLYGWKGAEILAKSARLLDQDKVIVFIGGVKQDIERFKKTYGAHKNILVIGNRPHSEVPYYLKSADVLVLPNSAKEDISKFYTSPLKLFEYMASKRPIVASNLPSIREILNKNNSVLVEPDNPESLAQGIKKVLKNRDLADKISNNAEQDVQKYSWEKRVNNIITFINGQLTLSNFKKC